MLPASSLLAPVLLFGQAPPSPDAMRDKVRAAVERARFSGVRRVTIRREGQLVEFREAISKDGRKLRTEYLDGPFVGRIVVENGRERRQYSPSENEITISPARGMEGAARLFRSKRGRWSGGPAVAGRATYQVTVQDDPGNVRQRAFVDVSTGVLLKRTVYDVAGAPVGGFEFVSIDYSPRLPGSLFRLDVKGARVVSQGERLRGLVAKGGFADVTLPTSSGYALDGVRVVGVLGQRVLVQQFVRDGNRVTLFQTPEGIDGSRLRRLAKGGVSLKSWTVGGKSFALVGGVPPAEIDRLAKLLGN